MVMRVLRGRTTIRISISWIKYQLLVLLFKINCMARNTSILLGEHFEEFISAKVSSGKYNSASEVIRTALRLLEAEDYKIKSLNKALAQGEKSRLVKNFDPKANLKKLHSKFL
jgi:antitoxin ParD1/3/4